MAGKAVTQWQKGQSGNPNGRPKDVRSISVLKNDLELAVREKLTPAKVTSVVNRLLKIVELGDDKQANAAGKTILSYALSKAAVQEAVAQRAPITIVIENATLSALQSPQKEQLPVIEAITHDVVHS